MNEYITIQIERDDFADMLTERVKFWTDDEEVIELYHDMYKYLVESGCFDGTKSTINEIVDNDWVNYTEVISKGDDGWEDILSSYKENEYECEYNGTTVFIEYLDEDKEMAIFRW